MTQIELPKGLPDAINRKLVNLQKEIGQIINEAKKIKKTFLDEPICFEFINAAPEDILSEYERAQSASFISRYDYLPELGEVTIIENSGKFWIEDIAFVRHILNEYRSIIQNQSDPIFYKLIHKFCFKKLKLDDPSKGTTINVFNTNNENITDSYIEWLNEHNKVITFIRNILDFDYLYNGILQHSDPKFSKRFLKDYVSGELNYIFLKHAHLLGLIKDNLLPYYIIMKELTSPKPGSL